MMLIFKALGKEKYLVYSKPKAPLLKFMFLLAAVFFPGLSYSQTIQYSYDELGRLTSVDDSRNGSRSYNYDAAGNRKNVIVDSDGASGTPDPVSTRPLAPKNLICSQSFPEIWQARWENDGSIAVEYYIIRTAANSNNEFKVTDTTYIIGDGSRCRWVKACNKDDICSAKAYF